MGIFLPEKPSTAQFSQGVQAILTLFQADLHSLRVGIWVKYPVITMSWREDDLAFLWHGYC